MIHYTCDRCGKEIDQDLDTRYIVRVELHPAISPVELEELDDDRDHLQEINEFLETLDDEAVELSHLQEFLQRQFDMCSCCYRKYLQNPLGQENSQTIGFSNN